MNIFSEIETALNNKLNSILANYVAMFSSKVVMLFQLGTPILVLYYGYSIMTPRGSNASIAEMLFNLARIGIIFAFVQNSSGLLDLSIGFIHELKTGFIEAKSLSSLLDEQFLTTQKLSQFVYKLDTFVVRGAIASLLIWLGAILVLASSAIVFISAEVGLTLLIATSPIFIGCLTYSFTRELFNGWLRSIFSCIITLIFATLIVRFGIDINNQVINQLTSNPEEKSILTIGATAFLMGVVVSSLVLISTKMASNIAGVAATSALQGLGKTVGNNLGLKPASFAAGMAGGLVGKAAMKLGSKIGGGILSKLKSMFGKGGNNMANDTKSLSEQSQKASLKQIRQTNSQGQ